MSIKSAVKFVSLGRCPLCGSKLCEVACHCRHNYRQRPNPNCHDCGGYGYTRRATRYGKLVPAWRWRTTAERLARMQAYCDAHGVSHTEFLEQAADEKLKETE